MVWTQERINLLVRLWVSGKSASAVAKEIGNITRNAVIGKIHRLGIANRAEKKIIDVKKQKNITQASTRKKIIENISKYLRPAQEYIKINPTKKTRSPRSSGGNFFIASHLDKESHKKISLLELKEKSCRWPSGDPKTREFSFCGAECAENMPYCDYHAKIAYSHFPKKETKQHIIIKNKLTQKRKNNKYQDDMGISVASADYDIHDMHETHDNFSYL
jgi:GcrA cell cycle regulator